MVKSLPNTKQGDTSKKTSITKHQVADNNQMKKGEKYWEDIPTTNTWNHFIETKSQKRVVFNGKQIPKQDVILESFSTKFRTQASCRAKDIGNETEKRGVKNEGLNFHSNVHHVHNPLL